MDFIDNIYLYLDKGCLKRSFILFCHEIDEFKLNTLVSLPSDVNELSVQMLSYDYKYDDILIEILGSLPIHIKYVKLQILDSCFDKSTNTPLNENTRLQLEYLFIAVLSNRQNIAFSGPTQQRLKYLKQLDLETKYTINDSSATIPIVDHVVWKCKELSLSPIPLGVKRITFYGNREIGREAIPLSVEYVKFKESNQCLSLVSLPSSIKYLCFDKYFNQTIDHRILVLPSSLVYLEFYFKQENYYHCLYSMGCIAPSIKYLKIHFEKDYSLLVEQQCKPHKPILVPKSVVYVYACQEIKSNIKYIDTIEYYSNIIETRSSGISQQCNIKKLVLCKDYKQIIKVLPDTLTSLDISRIPRPQDILNPLLIPPSLASLLCTDYSFIPSNHLFTHLGCRPFKDIDNIVIESIDGRPFTKEKIINLFRDLIPDFNIRIKEMEVESLGLMLRNVKYIDKLIVNGFVQYKSLEGLPDDLKELEFKFYSRELPMYPKSLKKLKYSSNYIGDPTLIPPSIKDLSLAFTKDNQDILFDPNPKRELKYKDIRRQSNYNNISLYDTFFNVWRNLYLKKKITSLNYPNLLKVEDDNDIILGQNRFDNITIFLNKYHFERTSQSHWNGIVGVDTSVNSDSIKISSKEITFLSIYSPHPGIRIPDGITHVQMREFPKHMKPDFPLSLKWLCISERADIDGKISIPLSVRHLLVKHSILAKCKIPHTVDTIEILADPFLHNQKLNHQMFSSVTLKRVVINTKIFQESLIDAELLTVLNQRHLLDDVYEIYDINNPVSNLTTVLIWLDDKVILPNIVPSNVKRIIFGQYYNCTILRDSLPNSITEINFGLHFSQCLSNCSLPPSIKYISFSKYIHPFQPNCFPFSVTHIKIKSRYLYASSIFNLPRSVSHLEIHCQKLVDIPSWIRHLKLFGTVAENVLNVGPSLVSLQTHSTISIVNHDYQSFVVEKEKRTKFSPLINIHVKRSEMAQYNGYIGEGTIRSNIISLELSDSYNHPLIEGSIPNNVTQLSLGRYYSQPLFFAPTSIKILNLGSIFNSPLTLSMIPPLLQELVLSDSFNQPLTKGILPPTLTTLQFGSQFSQVISQDMIPNGLKNITFKSGFYDKSILESLPENLAQLEISLECFDCYNRIFELNAKQIPQSVTRLVIGGYQPISNIDQLPRTIKQLSLGFNFTGKVPSTVETLDFNESIDKPLHFIFE